MGLRQKGMLSDDVKELLHKAWKENREYELGLIIHLFCPETSSFPQPAAWIRLGYGAGGK